jgi:hypothetical protein
LLEQGKIRKSQIEKNRFYQPIFAPGSGSSGVKAPSTRSLAGEASSRSENGGSGHDPVAPVADKAAQALAFLLNRKPSGVV